ncbi:cadherin-like domain-containing protein [Rubrobacter indicoceani]|uniref:cadherin-like domain-containing protein n=1 Tax=Rubrobacter indicoceani TaxID=2051957 RepID=UPI0013C4D684|nr:cadherin-like domain-containing protein [Rubrobacter indicoceani]
MFIFPAVGVCAFLLLLLVSAPALAQSDTFSNPASIAVPGASASGKASPYPSSLAVSGLGGEVTDVNVTLRGVSHGYPDDIDVLLVSPGGKNVLLMADSGGSRNPGGADITLDDEATAFLTDSSLIPSGSYKPTKNGTSKDEFPAPGPGAGPFGEKLSAFDGTDPNGEWKLYVRDDSSGEAGTNNTGAISGGYSLTIETTGKKNAADTPASEPPANKPPVIDAVTADTADEGGTAKVSVTASDPDGDSLTYDFDCNGDGDFIDEGDRSGSPEATAECAFDDDGEYGVPVRVTDEDGATDTGAATVTVRNVAPGATLIGPDRADEGETKAYTFEVNDPGRTDTHTAVASCGTGGKLVEGSLRYDQKARRGGFECFFPDGDAATEATVRVADSGGARDTDDRVVRVTVENVAPGISPLEDRTIEEDGSTGPIEFTTEDVDADTVAVSAASGDQSLVRGEDITLGGKGEDRTITVTPVADGSGATTISVTAGDGTDSATEEFTVTVTPVNDAPVAADAAGTIEEDGEDGATFDLHTLAIDGETADTDLVYAVDGGPGAEEGAVTISPEGVLAYRPAENYHGKTTVVYRATDKGGLSDTGTLSITVTPVNDAPVAGDDEKTATVEEPLTFSADDLTANDTDVDGDDLTVTGVDEARNGTVGLADGRVTFTGDGAGPAGFSYTVSDGRGGTDTGTVDVAVAAAPAANRVPVAGDDSAGTNEDRATNIAVRANDTDALTIESVSQPSNGAATVSGGRVRYTPDADFNGSDGFTYTVSDGRGATATASVRIVVRAVNDAPVAANDPVRTAVNRPVSLNALANDRDVDGDVPILTGARQKKPGTLQADQSGNIQFTPARNVTGVFRITYAISDGRGGRDQAIVGITVTK